MEQPWANRSNNVTKYGKRGECQWEINTLCDEFQKNMDNIFMERVGIYQTVGKNGNTWVNIQEIHSKE